MSQFSFTRTIPEMLTLALQYHRTGQLAQAEQLYQQVLSQQPHQATALHLLGVIAYQQGQLSMALDYYQRSIALEPNRPAVHNDLGTALRQQGEIEAAIAAYQKAIALQRDYTDAFYNLGNAYLQRQQWAEAIPQYRQAIVLDPNHVNAHCNLANALMQRGQIQAAIDQYQKAIAINANLPTIHYNLGNALKEQNQWDRAIIHYRKALALQPNYFDALMNLGAALRQQGQFEEATARYQQAIALQPEVADAYYNLGNVLVNRGRAGDAVPHFRQAIALQPDFLDAYLRLGTVFGKLNKPELATIWLEKALKRQPNCAHAYYVLGEVLAAQSQPEAAIRSFEKAVELEPNHANADWSQHLVLPVLYDTPEQILQYRQRLIEKLDQLIQQTDLETAEGQKFAAVGLETTTNFFLAYQGLDDRDLQQKYGQLAHQIMAANHPEWTVPLPPMRSDRRRKIRVGYFSLNFRHHTVGKLSLGWFKHADRQRFEIYTYNLAEKLDNFSEQFRRYSDVFHHVRSDLVGICEQIRADDLDILVFTDVGMSAIVTQVAALRLAPVQCTSWGHPVTTGLPTIDYFLSCESMEPENAQDHYTERLICLPKIGFSYQKPEIPPLTKRRNDFGLRTDAVVYLSCQSLFKYLPQYDFVFAAIAQQVPQAQFVFLRNPANAITQQFQKRLQRAFAAYGLSSEDFCVFLPQQDWTEYLNLNLLSDVFLDTFSWSGGNTTLEAIACQLPVVTCPGSFMRGRHSYGILRTLGFTETVAQTESEYIEIAVRLGLDRIWRQQAIDQMQAQAAQLYNDKSCINALESFYQTLVS